MSLSQLDAAGQAPYPNIGSVRPVGADASLTVLLVDDDPDMRTLMTLILEAGGCQVAEAGDGDAALDLLRGHPLPNIVVTDLMMPVMSGLELVRQLRSEALTAELPILIVSGNTDSDEGASVSALANAMMDKGSVVASLMATVRSIGTPRGLPTAKVA
jgi:CheY-like chemotaxis protein